MPKFLKFMQKKNKRKPLPVSDEAKQKLAEKMLSGKINKMAEWIEEQSALKGEEKWNLFDAYVVLGFINRQSIGPQLGEDLRKLADKTLDELLAEEIKEGEEDGKGNTSTGNE